MANDLQPYAGNPAYMLIAATSWADMGESPNTQAYAILRSFGAGDELQRWYSNQQHACAAGPASATYALIGLGGAAEGLETFVNDSTVTPIAQLSAFLLPGKDGFTPKGYTS
jgi:hypothetical protein